METASSFRKFLRACRKLLDNHGTLVGKRLLAALRELWDPQQEADLAYLPRWLLNHPTTGKEALFARRKRKLRMPQNGAFEINWAAPKNRRALSFKMGENLDSEVEELVLANLGLVGHIANRWRRSGLSYEDLYQEGYFALLRAAELYQPEKGEFGSYAGPAIERRIRQAVMAQLRDVRVTNERQAQIRDMLRAEREIAQEEMRQPTEQEVATRVGLTGEEHAKLQQDSQPPVGLDAPVFDWDKTRLELMEDREAPNPEELTCLKVRDERLAEALKELSPGLRAVLYRHDYEGRSYREIGKLLSPPVSYTTVMNRCDQAKAIIRQNYPELEDFLAA